MKSYLHHILMSCGVLALCGCSSVMTHTGGKPGYYPGTRASYDMLTNDETSWGLKPLVVLDMPFTAIMDTVLLPWDAFRTDKSVKARVEASEQKSQQTDAALPPADPQP